MNRILATLSLACLATGLSAQCFETSFGTLLGSGDDAAFPSTSTALPMNITFPMSGGAFASYTHITVNTNGCAFLWNAATGVLGATATGYTTTVATQVTNLRGAAGGSARIAPLWRDLNMLPANNGGVWLNTSIPGKCVITWANAVQFGQTTPIFTLQAQLIEATGEVKFFYSGTAASSSATIVGVSPGNAVVAVPGVDLCPGPNLGSTSQLMFQQFTGGTLDLAGNGVSFFPNGSGGYDESCGACTPALNQNYGTGCYSIPSQGFYESFADAALASATLQGNAMQLTISGGSYSATWIPGGASLYVAPSGSALLLPTTDDGDTVVTPTGPLTVPGGTVGTLTVSHNAIITLGTPGNNSGDFSPTGPELAAAARGAFYSWHDYNDAETGSGRIKAEEVSGVLYLTWDGVESYSTPTALNPSTIQFQIDLASGAVTYVWVTVDGDTTSSFGSAHVVGYKGVGAIVDPGSTSLAALSAANFTHNPVLPLSLSASPTPVSTGSTGTIMTYTTSNIPEAGPSTGLYVSTTILSLGQDLLGTDLGPGAPGCNQHITTLDLFLPVMFGGPTDVAMFSIPAGVPAGFQFFAQSVALVIPFTLPNGQNPAGVTTSNGVKSTVQPF
ncbi:MAG TPA: hypothetical protein VFZ65_13410 [Planctomycetota bacterium]|nr:hypothetical protein [Planctomycetota bacterium]